MNTDVEKQEITMNSPEMQNLITAMLERSETIKKRNEMTRESFHKWFCQIIVIIADKMGYYIKNVVIEIPLDLIYSFGKGFSNGMQRAKESSFRYIDRHKEE